MDIEIVRKIDFGEIDGYGDPNLEKYFLDNDYWNKIVESKVFFVVGKKGTGKSSIYRMIGQESFEKGCIVVNKDFGEFPFEKLLKLDDNQFAKPNQYQSIWKYVIYNLFIQNIAKLPEEDNDNYRRIKKYNEMFLGTAEDIHKAIVSRTDKKEGILTFHGLTRGDSVEEKTEYINNTENITRLNSTLKEMIIDYFVTSNSDSKIIIQFDRLDDNYNQYQVLDEYYQAIISLFKSVYEFNQIIRSKGITNAKVIIYIRSDIMKALANRDSESARWDGFKFELNWNVNNVKEIFDSDLYKMVQKRIHTSSVDLAGREFDEIFDIRINKKYGLFTTLVLQTLFRPRDLINLLIILQKEICSIGRFDSYVYGSVIKKYSNWLFNTEIANEINPVLRDDYKYVIELLRLCGSRQLSVKRFSEHYKTVKHEFGMSHLELLKYFYDTGIIENSWKNNTGKYMHRSIFRNEGDFDRNLNFRIIPVVWSGLTV